MRLAGRAWLLLVVAFLYLPIAVMVLMAFNASTLYTLPIEFSLGWFAALGSDTVLLDSARNSLWIAVATALIATTLGSLAAIALGRGSFRGRTLLQLLLLPPIAIPWLIIGTAMLIFFFWSGIGPGLHAMIIGHVALAIPYVVLVVGTGLENVRGELEEAARSLGAPPLRAFLAVTLPLIAPSLVAAGLFAFAVSLDQFVISYFLATPGVSTLPVQIYASIRKGFTPEINAISTLFLAVSTLLVLLVAWLSDMGGLRGRR